MRGPTSYSELAEVLDQLPILCRETRRRKGLSLRAAAKEMGVSFSAVNRFEQGKGAHLDNVVAILRWVGGLTPTERARLAKRGRAA